MKATRVFMMDTCREWVSTLDHQRRRAGYDVTGWVRNLPDGRVELQVAGEDEEVAAFLSAIRESTLGGHISDEDKAEIESPLR